MENSEIEETLPSIGEPKLHGEMCRSICAIYLKVLGVFPDIEAARPRSTSGIQALCSLHIALEKTKNVLQHCVECSKLYLAITGDSVVLKFEKARFALEDSLKRVEDIVPETIGSQIAGILVELRRIEFTLDPLEKQIGDEIIALLQQGRNFENGGNDKVELESFHHAASKLGITSSRAALREWRALKNLIERARALEDKRKESIIAYLLHLMKKYSKLFRGDHLSDENDSQGSTPCSPTTVQGSLDDVSVLGRNGYGFDRQMSKLSSFNFKPNFRRSDQMPVPPEELRCPISLQLMFDPVIIASGQTYERVCIEKWFSDGHNTCPKTQQQLPHLSLTPNYCVKGLVASWCEQNGVPVPDGPPDSLDLNYWRLALSESVVSCNYKDTKAAAVPQSNDTGTIEEAEGSEEEEEASSAHDECETQAFESYDEILSILEGEDSLMKKCRVVEQIRRILKEDEEARICMGANGFVEALVRFLDHAFSVRNKKAQEIAAMALFNLAVNNNRNKELMLHSGVLRILQEMIAADTDSVSAATALYLNLSCLEEAKPIIGATEAVPFLIWVLKNEADSQCKLDALHALYNISSHPGNVPHLLSAGIIDGLGALISHPGDHAWTEKCIAVLIYLASSKTAREETVSAPGLVTALCTVLDVGEPVEQEQAAACLLILCNASEKCCQMVLQEGVIPSLVSISVNGTMRGKQKAQKLLMLFREQRQRDPSSSPETSVAGSCESGDTVPSSQQPSSLSEDPKPLSKSVSRRKVGKAFSFWWKNKSFAVYQC